MSFSSVTPDADNKMMRRLAALLIALCTLLLIGGAVSSAGAVAVAGGPFEREVRAPAPRRALPASVACVGSCWIPDLDTSWQWQLQGTIDTSVVVDMYDIDLFETPMSTIDELHGDGSAVVCYLSAGSWEKWRPDADEFPAKVLGNKLDGWPGERWLDIRRLRVLRPIMNARLDKCADKGFDGVEFDNVEAFKNHPGFPIDGADQLRYNVYLANAAHARGLSAALKNDLSQIPVLVDYYDYALNEQCHQYRECDRLDRFVDEGKAVFGVEYRLRPAEFCPQANAHDFNFLKKELALRALPRIDCRTWSAP
ncbi:MAG: endo alpha-1,4 polygalactosaminidase [Actinomycetota bacterium]